MGSQACKSCGDQTQEYEIDKYKFELYREPVLTHDYSKDNFQGQSDLLDSSQAFLTNKASRYTSLVHQLAQHKRSFTDQLFKLTGFSAKRLHQIYPSAKVAYIINHREVSIGQLGESSFQNYHFALILKAIAKFEPNRLKRYFFTENNKMGLHVLNLDINGQDREVIIDDFVPVDKNNKPLYLKPQHQLWPVLIQKAYAKVHGGYDKCFQQNPMSLMQQLGGMPAQPKSLSQINLEQLIAQNKKHRHLLILVAKDKQKFNPKFQDIIPRQTFIINDIVKVNGKSVLELQTPYSESSVKYLDQKADLPRDLLDKDLIGIAAAKEIFDFVIVGYNIQKSVEKKIQIKGNSPTYLHFSCPVQFTANIMLIQYSKALTHGNYKYSNVNTDIIKENAGTYEIISKQTHDSATKEATLVPPLTKFEPGDYYLRVKPYWINHHVLDKAILSVSSNSSLTVNLDNDKPQQKFKRAVINLVRADHSQTHSIGKISYKLVWTHNHGYLYIQNQKSSDVRVKLNFKDCSNLMFNQQSIGKSREFQLTIEGREQVFLLRQENMQYPGKMGGYTIIVE